MSCNQCIHKKVCPHLKDTDAKKCKQYADKDEYINVVKCKDCAEWNDIEQECSHYYGFRANDYCSYGERKK